MHVSDRQELKLLLAGVDSVRRRKLLKRAAQLREADQADRRKRAETVDFYLLRLLRQASASTCPGQVVGVARGQALVRTARGDLACRVPSDLFGVDDAQLAVGDEVDVRDEADGPVIAVLQPRRTRLSRPDPHGGRERVMVANVDAVVVVVSVRTPPLRTRLVDRLLVAIRRGGADPILAVNKVDLLEDDPARAEVDDLLAPYVALGVPVFPVSADTGVGIAGLRGGLAGRLVAFVGHSGVGKSSLLNALHPGWEARVAQVSDGRGTGRHTTTAAELVDLGDGTRVVDTPGIRSFGLIDVSPAEVAAGFPDLAEAGRCRFPGCLHEEEPDCAVRDAVGTVVDPRRYDAYRRLVASVRSGAG